MTMWERIAYAIEEQKSHKLRTMLTLMGMIFGVGAVIAMLSIGEGAEKEALNLIDNMGLRNLIVESKKIDEDRLSEIRKQSLGLTLRDVEAVQSSFSFVENVAAEKDIKTHLVFGPNGKTEASVLAVTPSYFALSKLHAAQGRVFTPDDDAHLAQYVVLGADVAREMFPHSHPVGARLKINHVWFEVLGVLEDKQLRKSEFQGRALGAERKRLFIPLQSGLQRFKSNPLGSEIDAFRIALQAQVNPVEVANHLRILLGRRHNHTDDFEIVVPAALMQQHRETRKIFTIVMSCVAGISLLVGGIGIMNIMLANVLERTRDIGLLRAVGATRRDILWQFLLESSAVTLIGGFLGIFFGYFIAWIIAMYSDWSIGFSLTGVLISVGVCAFIGLVFGIYPAVKASELDPILALQRE